jgi:hypothetical protein
MPYLRTHSGTHTRKTIVVMMFCDSSGKSLNESNKGAKKQAKGENQPCLMHARE